MASPCPSCGAAMATQRLERRPVGEASIDLCTACRALWFDGYESLQLTPGATLALLQGHPRRRARERASARRATRLSALLGARSRSRATSRARRASRTTAASAGTDASRRSSTSCSRRDFVRPLPPAEIERLRRAVGTVRCNGCGARSTSPPTRMPLLPRADRGARSRRARAHGRRAVGRGSRAPRRSTRSRSATGCSRRSDSIAPRLGSSGERERRRDRRGDRDRRDGARHPVLRPAGLNGAPTVQFRVPIAPEFPS